MANHTPSNTVADVGACSAQQIFHEYQILGSWRLQVFRVLLVTLIYVGFGATLFAILGWPNTPFRGSWSRWTTLITTSWAIFVMIAEIESHDVGAFRPLSQEPFLWALTVPFGGAGGLLFLERLLNL